MLKPLVEKGVDGNLVAHGYYITDDIGYDENEKILFFSVGKNWFEEQERKRKEDQEKGNKTSFWKNIGM